LPRRRFIIGRVNFRKVKVSKAIWLVPLIVGLLVPVPSRTPLLWLPDVPAPAALADAEPPPLAPGLGAQLSRQGHSSAAGTCANVQREPRFEMISADEDPYPPAARNPAVCLAVYVPAAIER
jgi:hypothetical protein